MRSSFRPTDITKTIKVGDSGASDVCCGGFGLVGGECPVAGGSARKYACVLWRQTELEPLSVEDQLVSRKSSQQQRDRVPSRGE
jgi:hypothetical protein